MKSFVKNLETFLHTNTVWFFLTGLLLITSVWLMPDFSEHKTWGAFLGFFGSLLIQYSPILLFAFFRNRLRENLSTLAYAGVWVLVFIAFWLLNHPFIYDTLGISAFGTIPMHDGFVPFIIGGLLLITELILQSNDFIVEKTSGDSFLRKIDLDHIVIFLLLLLPFIQVNGFLTYFEIVEEEPLFLEVIKQLIHGVFTSIFTYLLYHLNRYFLIPSLLKKKGIVYYGAAILAVSLIISPIFIQMMKWLDTMLNLKYPISFYDSFNWISILSTLAIIIISAPVIILFEWMKQSKAIASLEKEKSETELNLLKQQINPHFFFNTLNNLYSLSLTKDEQTPEVVLQLSELMRYVIYKGKEKQVSIADEVKYIEDYIQLQQIRLAKNLDFKFEKSIEDKSLQVPPLLFINLIENAFKHGIEPAEGDCFLQLSLKSEKNKLHFTCENSFEEREATRVGTGLKNLKRRLELRFPERHELNISENEDTFKATLALNTIS